MRRGDANGPPEPVSIVDLRPGVHSRESAYRAGRL
jgi:hypothetical protein